ncbi:MAG TPA: PilZ domain-containing protein [Anaerolineales bacterium]|nr:PilZ domain-containing protein [Anaerolineales bacterium]
MTEKRKVDRKSLMAFTPVYAMNPRVLLGYVEDLTVLGAMVIGEKPMEPNLTLTLEISFPDDVPEIPNPLMRIPVRVAWCKNENNQRYFDIGFEFTELKADDKTVIEAILKRYEFRRELPASKVE